MNEIEELDEVAIIDDWPEQGLRAGDRGTVVDVLRNGTLITVEYTEDPYVLHLVDAPPSRFRVVKSIRDWSAATPETAEPALR